MPSFNKFGLSRSIPEAVKREVRQNTGFGCVLCGAGIYEYEHVDPEWADALIHEGEHQKVWGSRAVAKPEG